MKIKTRNFLLSFLMLTLVFGAFAFMPKTTMTAFAADPTSAQSNDVETVTVTTYDELREALAAEGDANIVLGADVSKIVEKVEKVYVAAVSSWFNGCDLPGGTIRVEGAPDNVNDDKILYARILENSDVLMTVKGNKTLDLNGHNILAQLKFVCNRVTYDGTVSSYTIENYFEPLSLIKVATGATLNLDDTSSGTPGSIFFDSTMPGTPGAGVASGYFPIYKGQQVRDIFAVYGTLNVFNGIIEAGRSKEQWIYDGTIDPAIWEQAGYNGTGGKTYDSIGSFLKKFNDYAYQQIWGSAVNVYEGGTFNSFGGYYYGRGEGYFGSGWWNDDIYVYDSEFDRDDNTYYAEKKDQNYCRDEVIYVEGNCNVNIYGGYFEGKGGANVFGGNPSWVKAYSGEFKNHKVDYVRCPDAMASNDLDEDIPLVGFWFDEPITAVVITGSYGETGLDESAYKNWSDAGLGIKDAYVNGVSRADGEIVPVKLKDGTASIKFEWNGLSENLEKAGCKLYPVVQYYLGETKGLHPYEIVDNSAIITTPLSYEGQKSTFKFDLYLLMPNGKQVNIGSHTVVVSVEKEEIERVSISLDTLVGGTTPANYEGKVNTTGVSIAEEAWYEYNGGSLKKMNDSDKFVAGNQYVYGVTFAFDSGYKFNPFTTVSINGIAARKSGDYFHWTSAEMTAKTELVANAVNSTVTVANGDTVTLKVNATGDGLEYVWQVDETVGAPSINRNFYDNVTLTCVNAGTYTYKCIVEDANGSEKTVTFTVKVLPKETSGTVPAQPAFKGSGFMDIEDSNNITVEKDGSITLIPNYVFNMNSNDITTTPVVGEVSFTWEIYAYDEDGKYVGKLGNVTTENLVIDANSEYINTKNVAQYGIILNIKNTAGGTYSWNMAEAMIFVVEPEATGNLGGQIGAEQEQATPYAMRRMSARSAESFEGTIVYLMKDEAIAYVTEANAEGYYMFTNIPYGSYTVKVEKEGYENYSKPVTVESETVEHDITVILHVCFNNEAGMLWNFPATQPICSDVTDGTLGNIEYYSCQLCGKFYDAERNLIADSANDPGSVNEFGVPYEAIVYPVHDYRDAVQEGAVVDQYIRHRAETCLEETTYWYRCINCHKSAGDDPSAVDMYFTASDSNQTHSYTVQSTDGDYFKEGTGVDCQDNKWYYYACEYCGMKDSSTVWMSEEKGPHIPHEDDGDCLTAVTCTKCDTVTTEAKATHVDENEDGKCDACGKDMPTLPDDGGDNSGDSSEPDSSEPDSSTTDSSVNGGSSDSGKKSGCGSAIGGIGVGMFALASAATFVFFKKRKEN